jgi:hypothetical protein
MGCSWVLYIGQGRLAEAAEERNWWRPVEFNGAAVSSLESSLRGRGNGGVAPLQKGKWRPRDSGRGGGTRCDGSRPDRRRRRGIRPEEGDEGGAGRVGYKGQVGRFWKWKTTMKMEFGWAAEGRLGRIQVAPLRKIENCFFEFLFQGNGIQIKSFEYFQTKFKLDSK